MTGEKEFSSAEVSIGNEGAHKGADEL